LGNIKGPRPKEVLVTTVNFGTERDATGAPRADDPALERIFRDSYASLTAEASAELQGAGHAHAVVSHAFLEAWRERERFESPAALEAFLHRAVHDGAVREKYRRAVVHHIQERSPSRGATHAPSRTIDDPPKSVDEAWAEVNAALHVAAPTATPEVRHALSRHGTAEHVAALAKRRVSWGAWVIALLAAVALVLVARMLGRSSAEAIAEKALQSQEARVLFSNRGQRALVSLTDDSKATLGPDSRLIIPPGFGTKLRTVRLEGTASFQVAPGQELPFVVRAGRATITALGTSFDVAADTSSDFVVVRVRSDRVQVAAGGESREIAAGEALIVRRDGIVAPTPVELSSSLAWTDGSFVVADRPLRDVLPLLRRWYALDLEVADSALLARRVSMTSELGAPRFAIDALETAADAALTWKGERMILVDRSAAKSVKATKGARPAR
jgi:transmembrane sensor